MAELAGDRRERDREQALAPWTDRPEPPAEVTALLSRLEQDLPE